MAAERIKAAAYGTLKWFVWALSPKMRVEGLENLPEDGAVIVANHAHMNGPIAAELYLGDKRYTWCASQMMTLREVPAYAYQDFWSMKPWYTHWYYRLCSYLIAPLSVLVFNSANTIPVYHDARVMITFRQTLRLLREGAKIVIFPEHAVPHNNIVYDFQDRFIDLARFYYKKTGKSLPFVPMYIAPTLRRVLYGKPIRFDPAAPIESERARICRYLQEEITAIARSLPRHIVVPYRNIPKKDYPYND